MTIYNPPPPVIGKREAARVRAHITWLLLVRQRVPLLAKAVSCVLDFLSEGLLNTWYGLVYYDIPGTQYLDMNLL